MLHQSASTPETKVSIQTEVKHVPHVYLDFDQTIILSQLDGYCFLHGEDNVDDYGKYDAVMRELATGSQTYSGIKKFHDKLDDRLNFIKEIAAAGKFLTIMSWGQKIELVCADTGVSFVAPFTSGRDAIRQYLKVLGIDSCFNDRIHSFTVEKGLVVKTTKIAMHKWQYEILCDKIKSYREEALRGGFGDGNTMLAREISLINTIRNYSVGKPVKIYESFEAHFCKVAKQKLATLLGQHRKLLIKKAPHLLASLNDGYQENFHPTTMTVIDDHDENNSAFHATADFYSEIAPLYNIHIPTNDSGKGLLNYWIQSYKELDSLTNNSEFSSDTAMKMIRHIAKRLTAAETSADSKGDHKGEAAKPIYKLVDAQNEEDSKSSAEATALIDPVIQSIMHKDYKTRVAKTIYFDVRLDIVLGNTYTIFTYLRVLHKEKITKLLFNKLASALIDVAPYVSALKKPHMLSETNTNNPQSCFMLILSQLAELAKGPLDPDLLKAWAKVLNNKDVQNLLNYERQTKGTLFEIKSGENNVYGFPHAFVQFMIDVMDEPVGDTLDRINSQYYGDCHFGDWHTGELYYQYKARHALNLIHYLVNCNIEIPPHLLGITTAIVMNSCTELMAEVDRFSAIEALVSRGLSLKKDRNITYMLLNSLKESRGTDIRMIETSAGLIARGAEDVLNFPEETIIRLVGYEIDKIIDADAIADEIEAIEEREQKITAAETSGRKINLDAITKAKIEVAARRAAITKTEAKASAIAFVKAEDTLIARGVRDILAASRESKEGIATLKFSEETISLLKYRLSEKYPDNADDVIDTLIKTAASSIQNSLNIKAMVAHTVEDYRKNPDKRKKLRNEPESDLLQDNLSDEFEEEESLVRTAEGNDDESNDEELEKTFTLPGKASQAHLWYDPESKGDERPSKSPDTFHTVYKLIRFLIANRYKDEEMDELLDVGQRFLAIKGEKLSELQKILSDSRDLPLAKQIELVFNATPDVKLEKDIKQVTQEFLVTTKGSILSEEILEISKELEIVESFHAKFRLLSSQALKDHLKACEERIHSGEYKTEDTCEVFAILRECHYNTTGEYPNNMQMFNIMLQARKGRAANVKTGQGKTLIIAMLAAYRTIVNKQRVGVFTSHDELAITASRKLVPFFKSINKTVSYLGAKDVVMPAADVIYAQSDRLNYILSLIGLGIIPNDSTLDDMFLIYDEFDRLALTELTITLHVVLPIIRYHTPVLYRINEYLSWLHTNNRCKSVEDYQQALIAHAKETDLSNFYDNETLNILAQSWFTARFKKQLLADYIAMPVSIAVPAGENKITYIQQLLTMIVDRKNTGELRPNLRWGSGVQTFVECIMHAAVEKEVDRTKGMTYVSSVPRAAAPLLDLEVMVKNIAQAAKEEKKESKQTAVETKSESKSEAVPEFKVDKDRYAYASVPHNQLVITPDVCHGSSKSVVSLLSGRQPGSVAGFTGTLGGPANRDLFFQLYNMTSYDSPVHLCGEMKKEPTKVVDSDEHMNSILASVKKKVEQGRPVLVFCQEVKSTVKLLAFLKANGIKKIQIANGMQESPLDEVINRAGEPEMVTISTSILGRGADPKNSPHIIITFIPENLREFLQLIGRGGRFGESGSYEMILRIVEIMKAMKKFAEFNKEVQHLKPEEVAERLFELHEPVERAAMQKILSDLPINTLMEKTFELFAKFPREIKEKLMFQWAYFFSWINDKAIGAKQKAFSMESFDALINFVDEAFCTFTYPIRNQYPAAFECLNNKSIKDYLLDETKNAVKIALQSLSEDKESKASLSSSATVTMLSTLKLKEKTTDDQSSIILLKEIKKIFELLPPRAQTAIACRWAIFYMKAKENLASLKSFEDMLDLADKMLTAFVAKVEKETFGEFTPALFGFRFEPPISVDTPMSEYSNSKTLTFKEYLAKNIILTAEAPEAVVTVARKFFDKEAKNEVATLSDLSDKIPKPVASVVTFFGLGKDDSSASEVADVKKEALPLASSQQKSEESKEAKQPPAKAQIF